MGVTTRIARLRCNGTADNRTGCQAADDCCCIVIPVAAIIVPIIIAAIVVAVTIPSAMAIAIPTIAAVIPPDNLAPAMVTNLDDIGLCGLGFHGGNREGLRGCKAGQGCYGRYEEYCNFSHKFFLFQEANAFAGHSFQLGDFIIL